MLCTEFGMRLFYVFVFLILYAMPINSDQLYNQSSIAHVTPTEHTFMLILIPTDSKEKRVAIRQTWLNFLEVKSSLLDWRFLSDSLGDEDRADTILTQAVDFEGLKGTKYHPIMPKMRAGARYSTIRRFTYCLWVEDDAIINVIDMLIILADYHNRTDHRVSKGLYMGTAISGMNSLDPEYKRITALSNYPHYMHGSAMVFGSGLLPAVAAMDHHLGLLQFGAGDTTLGVWLVGLKYDMQKFPRTVQIDSFPDKLDRQRDVFCTQALYYHMLKKVEHIWKYGEWMRQCEEDLLRRPTVQAVLQFLAADSNSRNSKNHQNHHHDHRG